jgi:phosphoribosylformylglycinamidine cyclo-ligase
MDYRTAGVDISKGDRLVARIKAMMGDAGAVIGHFGGAIPFPSADYKEPLLVSSMDSVGTKTAVAKAMKMHRGIGRDLVQHCINDIAVCGAEPLFFLDYIAMGEMDVELAAEVVGGVIDACRDWNCALVGGENAEMPGVYNADEYDLVGCITGVVEKSEFIDGKSITAGDVLIGFPSVGLHTNGYSLARRVVEMSGLNYQTRLPELGTTIGEALLAEHRCYLNEIRELRRNFKVKGLAHITGGGLPGNVPRIIPRGLIPEFMWGSWREPPIFNAIRKFGSVPEADMRSTFNLGVGLVAVVDPQHAESLLSHFPDGLYAPFRIGSVRKADET